MISNVSSSCFSFHFYYFQLTTLPQKKKSLHVRDIHMKNKPTTKQLITFEPTKGKKVLRVPALNLQ